MSRPQARQTCISLSVPFLHDLQGIGMRLPFLIFAEWILQYSPQQLLLQSFVSPTLSQAQFLWPFIYQLLFVYLNGYPWLGGAPGGGWAPKPLACMLFQVVCKRAVLEHPLYVRSEARAEPIQGCGPEPPFYILLLPRAFSGSFGHSKL